MAVGFWMCQRSVVKSVMELVLHNSCEGQMPHLEQHVEHDVDAVAQQQQLLRLQVAEPLLRGRLTCLHLGGPRNADQ